MFRWLFQCVCDHVIVYLYVCLCLCLWDGWAEYIHKIPPLFYCFAHAIHSILQMGKWELNTHMLNDKIALSFFYVHFFSSTTEKRKQKGNIQTSGRYFLFFCGIAMKGKWNGTVDIFRIYFYATRSERNQTKMEIYDRKTHSADKSTFKPTHRVN